MNSKLLLCGIIVSTFLTVSCQKKGARPPLATAAVQSEKNAPNEQTPKIPESDQLQLPPVNTPQKVETKEEPKETTVDKKEDSSTSKTEHKDEVKKEDDQAKKEDSSKEEKKDVPVVKADDKKDTPTTKEKVKENINQEKTPDKKEAKDDKAEHTKIAACTDYLKDKVAELNSTEGELKKEKDQTKAIDLMKSYIKSCGDFFRSINNHNGKSCSLPVKDKSVVINETLFTERCNYVGYELEQAGVKNLYAKKHQIAVKAQIESLKATNYVLSEDTHNLLKKENNDFKMFILNGEIKTDEALTKDSKSTACSFTSTDISIIPGNSVIAKVTSIESADINTEKRALLKLTLTSQDKDIVDGLPDDHKLSLTASLICKNLNIDHFNLAKFEKSVEKFFTKK